MKELEISHSPKIEPIEKRNFFNLRKLCRTNLENYFMITTNYTITEQIPRN